MYSQAIKELQARKKAVLSQIRGLNAEIRQIDKAIAAVAKVENNLAALKVSEAPTQPAKKGRGQRRQMSPLGRLKIKLGSLNRYGKKEEAKKVLAQIAELEGKGKK